MKRTFLTASLAASWAAMLLCTGAVQAEPPGAASNIDASKMPESGPLVVGGTGQTAGPNSKNQAISPMPGMQEEELSERPPDTVITTPDVRPITRNPARNPAATR
jgi:hypothetical protein